MKRTRQWWAALTPDERSELVWLEKADKWSGRSGYIPDDCSECGSCGTPSLGSGLCPACLKRLMELVKKADTACAQAGLGGASV